MTDATFHLLLFTAAILSGGTATITGFGIGSILTPLMATRLGVPLAVAAVTVPHAIATGVRAWRLRRAISWSVMRTFGILSAVGGLAGALLYARFSSRALTFALALLLIATAIAAITEWTRRLHPSGYTAAALGLVSGLFGGLAGNQGGLRAAALLAFSLSPAAFVATSTAVGLAVDAARMPIYVWRAGDALLALMLPMSVATAGVLIGTIAGERLLLGLSPERFKKIVALLIGGLGVWLLSQAGAM